MKRKMNTRILAVIMAVTLSETAAIPAMGAEFTDKAAVEAVLDDSVMEAGEDETAAEPVFDAGEIEVEAAFSDNELPEGVIYHDGMEYQYVAETDSYILTKGKNIENVGIPKEINGKLITEIGTGAFVNCSNLRFVRVLGPIKVASGAFVNCPKLGEFMVTALGTANKFAVDSFDSDTKVVVVSCGSIESSELDEAGIFHVDYESGGSTYGTNRDGVTTVSAFYVVDCDDSSSLVHIGKNINVIRRRAFFDCKKVREVVIDGNGLRTIETKAFADCSNLEKILIPASVTDISADAFEGAEQAVIYTPKGAFAEAYAEQKNMTVVHVDENGQTLEEVVGKAVIDSSCIVVAEGRTGVSLTSEVKNADGYDFAISDDKNCIETGAFNLIKRRTEPEASFNMEMLSLSKRYFYVTCRPWREIDGKKVYGVWADTYRIHIVNNMLTRTKPPVIRKVKVSGNKVTVTLSATSYPDAFYCVLGSTKDAIRPWKIKYVKRDQKSKTITFTNVKKGTYYIGARSYKTMKNGKQEYGKWSGMKKVTVK